MSSLTLEAQSSRWSVLAVCSAALMLPLSFSAGVIATPAIAVHPGGSPLALSWITNSFLLSFGSLLMAAGSLADRYGRKRLFISGVLVFTLLSLLTPWLPSVVWLDIVRALQGGAAAAALAGGSAAMANSFNGEARARAFSMLGTSFGVGLAAGPVVAGMLMQAAGWHSVFLCCALFGAVALLFGTRYLAESRNPEPQPLDWAGIITFSTALTLFTWGLLQMADGGSTPLTRILLLASLLTGALFVFIERRTAFPMLDLSLFRYGRFVGVQLLPVATCYCFVVLLVLLPLRFMGFYGYDALTTGLLMLAISLPMLIIPSIAVSLTRRCHPGTVSAGGLLLAAAGIGLLSAVTPQSSLLLTLLAMLLIGTGSGLPWGLMDNLSVSVVPPQRAGMATGIFSTVRVAGEGVALASVSSLFTFLLARLANHHHASAESLPTLSAGSAIDSALLPMAEHAFQQLLWVLLVVTVICAVAIWLCLVPRGKQIN
ncbi:MFS transporter [Pantoea coffeiphila]|uniref:MFS transporter n=1 Tax=Pantoea coffeiphila TaxID=1465635 RepID=A0A2S9I7V0_9GAMM|nr:MFS transporter [Pantoea coffeiphila]PRD13872.1 MFS transporter [Pantoea coffeiphila]